MQYGRWQWFVMAGIVAMSVSAAGCAFKVVKRAPGDTGEITVLNDQLERLQLISQSKEAEAEQLRRAKEELERQLAKEIDKREVSVNVDERGIIITFVAEVLFDSGKADLRPEAEPTLSKVANILRKNVPNQPIGIEGHTDNQPIKHSGWRSNWELSTARATSVLHYLVDDRKVEPTRVAATGYGEYRPVGPNDTKEQRQKNRRVEIVVYPQTFARKTTRPIAATGNEQDGK